MTYYVVVAAVRIQSWLARTPRLALIRGASRALHEATTTATVNQVLRGAGLGEADARVADDAGDIDGVVVVQTTGVCDGVVRRALQVHVRRTLPGLEWTVWAGQAPTVLDALESAKINSELILAELLTVPFARRCQGCGAETAAGHHRIADDEVLLGPDCVSRWAGGRPGWLPGHSYRDGLNIPGEDPPRTMDDLARAQGRARESAVRYGGKRNHVAVLCADGNSIGDLVGAVPRRDRRHVVGALDQATRDALSAAAADVTDQTVVVEPHFVGGDDILVSVPAPLGWSFAMHLARRFEQFLGDYLSGVGAGPPAAASLGIGLCFTHASYPFAQAREVAFAAMKQAKSGVQGSRAAAGWVDLTAEDDVASGRYRTVRRLHDLRAGNAQGGDLMVALTNSARAEIAGEVDQGGGRFYSPAAAVDRLVNYARRANQDHLEHWLAGTPPAEAVTEIRDGLSLARWWPGPPVTPASAGGPVRHGAAGAAGVHR